MGTNNAWELASSSEGMQKLGKTNLKFLARLEGNVTSAGDDNSEKIRFIGKNALKLISKPKSLAEHDNYDIGKFRKPSGNVCSFPQKKEGNNEMGYEWNTSEWSTNEIESSCITLIDEVETSCDKERMEISIKILLRLMAKHVQAVSFVKRDAERIVHKALPPIHTIKSNRNNLSHLLAALAPSMADDFSLLDVPRKICRSMIQEMKDSAYRIQLWFRFQISKKSKEQRNQGIFIGRTKRKYTGSSAFPREVKAAYLSVLLVLTKNEFTNMSSTNRVSLANCEGVLILLPSLIQTCALCRIAALQLAKEISRESSILRSLLNCNFDESLRSMLKFDDFTEKDSLKESILVMEILELLAMNLKKINREEHGSFPKPQLVACLIQGLKLETVRYMILRVLMGVMSFENGYASVLQEVTNMGGRALELLINSLDNVQRNAVECYYFLRYLASKQSGRDGMIASQAVSMLRKVVIDGISVDLTKPVLALLALVSLSQDESSPCEVTNMKHGDQADYNIQLYKDLICNTKSAYSREKLEKLPCIDLVIAFLVRSPPRFYDLSKKKRRLGSIILSRLLQSNKVCNKAYCNEVIKYFIFLIEDNTCPETMNFVSKEDTLVLHQSTEAACWGLVRLAQCNSIELKNVCPRNEVRQLVSSKNVLGDVEKLLILPDEKNVEPYLYRHHLGTTKAAIALVSTIANVPEIEFMATLKREPLANDRECEERCVTSLKELLSFTAEKMMAILYCCSCTITVAMTLEALSKLASTEATCNLLLQKGVVKILVTYVFPEVIGDETHTALKSNSENIGVRALLDLAAFQLVACLARTKQGRIQLQSTGMLRKCIKSFYCKPDMDSSDQNRKEMIANLISRIARNAPAGSEYFLFSKEFCRPTIIALVDLVNGSIKNNHKVLFSALCALDAMGQDQMHTVPLLVDIGVINELTEVIKTFKNPSPILRPALNVLRHIALFSSRASVRSVFPLEVCNILYKISCNFHLERGEANLKTLREPMSDIARDIIFLQSEKNIKTNIYPLSVHEDNKTIHSNTDGDVEDGTNVKLNGIDLLQHSCCLGSFHFDERVSVAGIVSCHDEKATLKKVEKEVKEGLKLSRKMMENVKHSEKARKKKQVQKPLSTFYDMQKEIVESTVHEFTKPAVLDIGDVPILANTRPKCQNKDFYFE